MKRAEPAAIATALGFAALFLVLGALGFQYIAKLAPCEMCQWQRWPHIAAAVVGIIGAMLIRVGLVERGAGNFLVALTALLIAVSGAIGVYHAGVEWHWWAGPSTCTGPAFQFHGKLDLNAPVVPCDAAAWRLFGISLAGYNAIISLGLAAAAFLWLARAKRRV